MKKRLYPVQSRPVEDLLRVRGQIFFYALPETWTAKEYTCYWLHMSKRERERYLVHHVHNLLTTSGRTQILTFMGASGTTSAFAQYIAFGTFPIAAVSPGDTSVQTEIYRAVPASFTVSGTQVDISLTLPSGSANGTLTNAGIYGINATSTSGSGTLMTHALLNNFNKVNGTAYNVDYVLNLN